VAAALAKLALEGLFRVVCGERPSIVEFFGRWGSIGERVWAAALNRAPEVPAEEMGDRWPVMWDGRFVGWLKDPRHKRHGCVGSWIPSAPPDSEEFVTALKCCSQTPLVVSVGGVPSLLDQPLSECGELFVSWLGPDLDEAVGRE
jgi:hypothetical protein